MLSIRIDTGRAALAALLFAAGMTATGALAQTAADSAPGKPIQLVRNFKQASKSAATKPVKTAAKSKSKWHHTLAERKRAHAPVQVAQEPADAWSAASAVPFNGAAVAALSPRLAETVPSELVVGGQTVQIGSPDRLNEIDLTAKDDAAPVGAATLQAAKDGAEVAAKSDLANAVAAPPSEIGSTAWLLQVLAALGGAVAAGSAAWLMIGSAPQRMYG
jgi:hypothetical protein